MLDKSLVKNNGPVSELAAVSKIFGKNDETNSAFYWQMPLYICGYGKGYCTQQALTSKIEKWRKIIDEKGCAGAILMDFSKAFDTINHELLINYMHTVSVKRHFKFELLVK